MSEVLTIQIGNFGNGMGTKFWEELCMDHDIDTDGRINSEIDSINKLHSSFFIEKQSGIFQPRLISVSSDQSYGSYQKASPYRKIFPELYSMGVRVDNLDRMMAQDRADRRFYKFDELRDEVIDDSVVISLEEKVRTRLEQSDNVTTIQIFTSMTGTLGTTLFRRLDEFDGGKDCMIYSLMPELEAGYDKNHFVKFYNQLPVWISLISGMETGRNFAPTDYFNHSTENRRGWVPLYQSSAFAKAINQYNIKKPSRDDLNTIFARAIANITSSMRMPGSCKMGYSEFLDQADLFSDFNVFYLKDEFIGGAEAKNDVGKMEELFFNVLNDDNCLSIPSTYNQTLEGKTNLTWINYRGLRGTHRLKKLSWEYSRDMDEEQFNMDENKFHILSSFCDVAAPGTGISATSLTINKLDYCTRLWKSQEKYARRAMRDLQTLEYHKAFGYFNDKGEGNLIEKNWFVNCENLDEVVLILYRKF